MNASFLALWSAPGYLQYWFALIIVGCRIIDNEKGTESAKKRIKGLIRG